MYELVLEHIIDIDYDVVEQYLSKFLRDYLDRANGNGYIVGVSGGLDSATVLALASKSLGKDRVFALILPDSSVTPKEDVEDAIYLVKTLGVRHHIIEISSVINIVKRIIPIYENDYTDKLPLGNLRARLRMCLLYYYANKMNYLVLGASDRSEYLIGYFTKYGDGAVDVAPLTVLYKTQVRRFANRLGVPDRIIKKPSSPRLWPNHLAEEELGVRYEDIDLILVAYTDLGFSEEEIPNVTGIDKAIVDRVLGMYRRSAHKRQGMIVPEATIIEAIRSMMLKNINKHK